MRTFLLLALFIASAFASPQPQSNFDLSNLGAMQNLLKQDVAFDLNQEEFKLITAFLEVYIQNRGIQSFDATRASAMLHCIASSAAGAS